MQRRMDAAGAVDAQNAPTAPWKTAQNAVSHSYHRHSHRESGTEVLPMFPVNFVTYLSDCSPGFPAHPAFCSMTSAIDGLT